MMLLAGERKISEAKSLNEAETRVESKHEGLATD